MNFIFSTIFFLVSLNTFCSHNEQTKINFVKGEDIILSITSDDDFLKTDLFKSMKNQIKNTQQIEEKINNYQFDSDKNNIPTTQPKITTHDQNVYNVTIIGNEESFIAAYMAYNYMLQKKTYSCWTAEDFIHVFNTFDALNNPRSLFSNDETNDELGKSFVDFIEKQEQYENLSNLLKTINNYINDEKIKNESKDYIRVVMAAKFPHQILKNFCEICKPINFNFLPPEIKRENIASARQIGNWAIIKLEERRTKESLFFGTKNLRYNNTKLFYNGKTRQFIQSNIYRTSTNQKYLWMKDVKGDSHIINLENANTNYDYLINYCDKGILEDIFEDNFFTIFSDKEITFFKDRQLIQAFSVYDYIDDLNNIHFSYESEKLKCTFVKIDEENDGIIIFENVHGTTKIRVIDFSSQMCIGNYQVKDFFINFGIKTVAIDDSSNSITIKTGYSGTVGIAYVFSIEKKNDENATCFETIRLNSNHKNRDQDSRLCIDGGSTKKCHPLSDGLSLNLSYLNMMGPSRQTLYLQFNKTQKKGTFYLHESDNWETPITSFESSRTSDDIFFTFKNQDKFYQFSAIDFLKSFSFVEKNDLNELYDELFQSEKLTEKEKHITLAKLPKNQNKQRKYVAMISIVIIGLSAYFWKKQLIVLKNKIQKNLF